MFVIQWTTQVTQMIKILINNKLQIIINIINVHNPDCKWTSPHASRPLGSFESLSGTRMRWLHVNISENISENILENISENISENIYHGDCMLTYENIYMMSCQMVGKHGHPWGISTLLHFIYIYHADWGTRAKLLNVNISAQENVV